MKALFPLLLFFVLVAGGYYWLDQRPAPAASGLASDASVAEPEAAATQVEASLVGKTEDPALRTQRSEPEVLAQEANETGGPIAGPSIALRTLRGRVVDERGAPIEGVEIRVRTEQPSFFGTQNKKNEPDARSDADGRFAVYAETGNKLTLAFDRSEYVPREQKVPDPSAVNLDLGDVVLDWAMILEGRLVDVRGAGVAGARLRVPEGSDNSFLVIGASDPDAGFETGPDGSFRLDTLAPGPWRVWIHSDEYRDRIEAGEVPQGLRQSGILWTVDDGLTLRGRVLNVPRDESRALMVRLQLLDEDGISGLMKGSTAGFLIGPDAVELDAGRSFEFRGLHPGARYALGVVERDKAWSPWLNGHDYLSSTASVASDVGEVNLTWSLRASLRVRVVDSETKTPIDDVRFQPKDWEWMQIFDKEHGTQAKDGTWSFQDLPVQEEPLVVAISAKGYEDHRLENLRFQAGQTLDLGTIALKRGAMALVHVTDRKTGKPIAGAEVRLEPKPRQGLQVEDFEISDDGTIGVGKVFTAKTDNQGLASIQFQPHEERKLSVHHDEYAPLQQASVPLDAYRETPMELVLSAGGTVVAHVVDAEGQGVSGVRVTCNPVVEPASEGSVRVRHVTMGDGPEMQSETTNARGWAKFRALAPGDYQCEVKAPAVGMGFVFDMGVETVAGDASANNDPRVQRVTVLEEETSQVELLAPVEATLEGTLREDGQPLVGATVSLVDADNPNPELMFLGGGGPQARTDAKGVYHLDHISPGKKTLTIDHDQRAMSVEYPLEIQEGSNTFSADLVVTIVAGRAVDPDGHGIPGLQVSAERAVKEGRSRAFSFRVAFSDGEGSVFAQSGMGHERLPVVTDDQGYFRLRGVLAGTPIRVTAKGDGWQEGHSEDMTLPEGAMREGIQIRMQSAGKLLLTIRTAEGDLWKHIAVELIQIEDADGKALEPGQGPQSVEISDSKGLATYEGLGPGKYQAKMLNNMVPGPGGQDVAGEIPPPIEVTIRSGATTEALMKF